MQHNTEFLPSTLDLPEDETSEVSTPPEPENLDSVEAVTRLAKLSPIEYDKVREEEAKKLGARALTLDKEVSKARGVNGTEIKGRAIELYEPEPWHESVIGSAVLNDAVNLLSRHMVMSKADIYISVLWAAHTFIFEGFYHSARLLITAPDKECGKSVLLFHMIGNLVNRPQSCENITPAPFFRIAELYKPTFLIDEADVFIKQDADLSGALNGGWEPHGGVIRCCGDDQEPRHFSTFCPTAIAGIEIDKKLPGPTVSRSIVINLDRAIDGEISKDDEYDARKHKKALIKTGRRLARWCGDNRRAIHKCDPLLPNGVKNRLADKWRPLFAIAEMAGGGWPNHAITGLMSQAGVSEPSKSELLLQDIKSVLPPEGHIFTDILIHELCQLEDSIWAQYNFKEFYSEDKKIKATQIARLLKKYRIKPKDIKINGVVRKGYRREELEAIFSRYTQFPAHTPILPATTLQDTSNAGYSQSLPATCKNRVAGREQLQATNTNESNGVAGKIPPDPENDDKGVI